MTEAHVSVSGFETASKRLRQFDKRVRKSVLAKAARAGGGVFLKAVKAKAPSKNRILKTSFAQKVKRYKNGNVVSVVGQDLGKLRGAKSKKRIRSRGGISGRGDVVPSHLVELPVRPHRIPGRLDRKTGEQVARVGGINAWSAGASVIFTRRINHPGHRGTFFISRASQSAGSPAKKRTETKLILEVAKAADSVKK